MNDTYCEEHALLLAQATPCIWMVDGRSCKQPAFEGDFCAPHTEEAEEAKAKARHKKAGRKKKAARKKPEPPAEPAPPTMCSKKAPDGKPCPKEAVGDSTKESGPVCTGHLVAYVTSLTPEQRKAFPKPVAPS